MGTVAIPHLEALGEDALNGAPMEVPEDLRGEFSLLQFPEEEKVSLSFLDQSGSHHSPITASGGAVMGEEGVQ